MNKVILCGRLTRDPETRYAQGVDPLCITRYTLAVDRPTAKEGQQSTDFISCVALGKAGQFAEKYLHKGMKIIVEGRIVTGSYTNKEGTKIYTTDVNVQNHEFTESKAANQKGTEQGNKQEAAETTDGFMNIPDGIDEELPFT